MAFILNLFSGVSSFFKTSEVVPFTDEDFASVLNPKNKEENDNDAEEIPVENMCQHRIGTITKLVVEDCYGLIDDKYYFDIKELDKKDTKEGQAVNYTAYRSNAHEEWKIKKITIVEVDSWDDSCTPFYKSEVQRENPLIQKIIIGQVEEKDGRNVFIRSLNFTFNLNNVQAEFLPAEGDWLSMTALVEIIRDQDKLHKENVVEVTHVAAVRCDMFDGRITHLDEKCNGIINNHIYFTTEVCNPGYIPKINDLVVGKYIESQQGSLTFRAIRVLPVENVEDDLFLSNIEFERLFDSKHGINVSSYCPNKDLKLHDEIEYQAIIENCGKGTQVLVGARLNDSGPQTMSIITDLTNPISIAPNERFVLLVKAKAGCTGYYSEILILDFKGEFKIGCIFDYYVDATNASRKANTHDQLLSFRAQNQERRNAAIKKLLPTKVGFRVPGRRPIKPAAFLPEKLDIFPIPQKIKSLMGDGDTFKNFKAITDDLLQLIPELDQELTAKTYWTVFHNLLHLEDMELAIAIKKYDKERACFDVRGEYISLEIPNLAESRPSLVIGDKLIAKDPAVFCTEGPEYEAYIHKVSANSILLKFNESFHSSYNGKDYSITFEHSRTGIRRCHQAVNLAVQNLGKEWLFPDTLNNVKPPQLYITGEFPSLEEQVEQKHVCGNGSFDDSNKENQVKIDSKESLSTAEKLTLLAKNNNITLKCETSNQNNNNIVSKSKSKIKKNRFSIRALISDSSDDEQVDNNAQNSRNENVKEVSNAPRKMELIRRENVLRWINGNLNCYQRDAVRNILKGEARPFPYVIFGPPGTGKTVTVVETILQITLLIPKSRILVATPSNSSADLICERLLQWNLLQAGELVRLVGYNYMMDDRMPAVIKPYCTVVDMKNNSKQDSYEENGVRYSTRDAIGRHRITVGTCVSVGVLYQLGLPKGHFTHIIVDEAGQASEPEVLIPLGFLSQEGQAVLAGDPRQLGPVITSRTADSLGLGESLLSRFLTRFPYHRDLESYPHTFGYDPRLVTWLLYNYRSLPEILNLYSNLFYDSKLIPKICSNCSEEATILENLKTELPKVQKTGTPAVIFDGVRGVNAQEEDSPSWFNDHEVVRVIEYVRGFYSCKMTNDDIGIITPYQKQVFKIRGMLKLLDLDVPKVGTVEEFQGQERKIIILSTVRSDENLIERDRRFALGFVSSKQRLNVAISRARCLLMIIGNPHLLAQDSSWRYLLKSCIDKKCYVGSDLPITLK